MSGNAARAAETRRRLLIERRDALAGRGSGVEMPSGINSEARLVCEAGGRLFAVDPAAVASVRPFSCHGMPLLRPHAAGIVLGAVLLDGRLFSVLSLARLFGGADPGTAVEDGGIMLLLRPPVPAGRAAAPWHAALRVDRVDGTLPVRAIGDEQRAWVPGGGDAMDDGTTGDGATGDDRRVALLLDAEAIASAIARLDGSAAARSTSFPPNGS